MKLKTVIITFTAIIIINCKSVPALLVIDYQPQALQRNKPLSKDDLKNWQYKDIIDDTISGISLERLYKQVLKDKIGKEIIVAILDTQINIEHEDLSQSLWTNIDEIPNNGIDDDNNGYIDDIHGWNFLGNKKGEQLIWATYAHIRFLNAYDSLFSTKKDGQTIDSTQYKTYKKALAHLKKRKTLIEEDYQYVRFLKNGYPKAKRAMDSLFKHGNYTVKNLDSVYAIYNGKNNALTDWIDYMHFYLEYNMFGKADKIYANNQLKEQKSNNQKYNARTILGDNPNDFTDRNYGNNSVNGNLDTNTHGTKVSGVLVANRDNHKGIRGMYKAIKIMPVVMQPPYGTEYDKDIALAIRYAVDNGAKVISYSASKYFSLHSNWVQEALQYADKHNVIFVRSAGNQSKDNDINIKYPNDDDPKYTLNSFITVGAIDKHFKKPLWSNYGKKTVDLFAPGVSIYTTIADGGYQEISGTSMSTPLVAGVAAMLFSYYPELTAKEVKEIILKSTYKPKEKVVVQEDPELILSYDEMCTSGGFLNAYNAFMMAAEITKKKK